MYLFLCGCYKNSWEALVLVILRILQKINDRINGFSGFVAVVFLEVGKRSLLGKCSDSATKRGYFVCDTSTGHLVHQ